MAQSKLREINPDFNAKFGSKIIRLGLGLVIIFTVMIFLLVQILFRGQIPHIGAGTILRQWYLWIFILFVFSMLFLPICIGVRFIISGVSLLIRRNNWINGAARAQATIVDKRMRHDWEYRDDYSYEVFVPELELKYTPTLAITTPSEQTIWAHVDILIYEKYKLQDTICIYYSVTDPLVFLIEGE